jgi:hypothetical protein
MAHRMDRMEPSAVWRTIRRCPARGLRNVSNTNTRAHWQKPSKIPFKAFSGAYDSRHHCLKSIVQDNESAPEAAPELLVILRRLIKKKKV